MNRFFVPESGFHGEQVTLSRRQAHQIRDVLRMKPGDVLIVLDNEGLEYEAALTEIRRDTAVAKIVERRPAPAEPAVRLTLYQSLLPRDKFELILQKCTEIGVARFVPVIAERSIVRNADAVTPRKLARWWTILTEAAEQSHRGRIPQLAEPTSFADSLAGLAEFGVSLIASPHEQQQTLRSALRKEVKSIAVLIGPEGGFTKSELGLACDAGAIPITLGPRILRTETAAIVTTALVLYELSR
jgi:16S rRNA (uracil1498-N3)-methyltransferase